MEHAAGPTARSRNHERVSEESSGRDTWAVVETDLLRTAAEQVCTAFLDVMAEAAPWACIDAWSDYRDGLPAEVEHAQTALRHLHAHRDGRDTFMGIDIDRSDPAQEALQHTYAAWSIHVELLPAAEQDALVTVHDGASSITAELTTPRSSGCASGWRAWPWWSAWNG